MSHPSSRSVVISAAVLGLLAGCNGGDGDADAGPPQRSVSETTTSTTAPPAELDLSQPIPGGSLHGTPRPPLENTGDDYVAIFESLVANLRWLSENPSISLIPEIFVPGTPGHDVRVPAYQYLIENGYRFADEGYHVVSVEVVDARAEAVSLTVVQRLEYEKVVDAAGTQVGELKLHGQPETTSVLLSPAGDGKWQIASWTSLDTGVEL